jgi:hypothetical protein
MSEPQGFSLVGNFSLLVIAATVFKFLWDANKEQRRQRIDTYEKLRKELDDPDRLFTVVEQLETRAAAADELEEAKKAGDPVKIAAAQTTLSTADNDLRQIKLYEKMRFASLIEFVALHAKSGTFSYELANYQFGDIARKCWDADAFWEDIEDGKPRREEPLWGMFYEFIRRVNKCDYRLTKNPKRELRRTSLGVDWYRLRRKPRVWYRSIRIFLSKFAVFGGRKAVLNLKGER